MKIWKPKFFLLLFVCIFILNACLNRRELPDPPLMMAMVNGVALKEDELRFHLDLEKIKYDDESFSNEERFERLKKEVLNQMIRNRVIADFGIKKGIKLTQKELAYGMNQLKKGYSDREFEIMLSERGIPKIKWRDMASEVLLVQKVIDEYIYQHIVISSREIDDYYRKHIHDFTKKEEVRVRHIVTDTLEKAQKIHDRILKGENFAKVAIMHSLSPDRAKGGDLGFFSKGTHPEEFDKTCFNLKPGEVSSVVKSPYGFHIFKLIEKRNERVIALKEVESVINTLLKKKVLAKRYEPWYKAIYTQSQVQIFDHALDAMKPY